MFSAATIWRANYEKWFWTSKHLDNWIPTLRNVSPQRPTLLPLKSIGIAGLADLVIMQAVRTGTSVKSGSVIVGWEVSDLCRLFKQQSVRGVPFDGGQKLHFWKKYPSPLEQRKVLLWLQQWSSLSGAAGSTVMYSESKMVYSPLLQNIHIFRLKFRHPAS